MGSAFRLVNAEIKAAAIDLFAAPWLSSNSNFQFQIPPPKTSGDDPYIELSEVTPFLLFRCSEIAIEQTRGSGIGSTKVPTIMNGVGLVDLQPHILLYFTWAK